MKTDTRIRKYFLQNVSDTDRAAGIICRVRDARYSTTWALTRTGPDVDVIDPLGNAELSGPDIRALLSAWDAGETVFFLSSTISR